MKITMKAWFFAVLAVIMLVIGRYELIPNEAGVIGFAFGLVIAIAIVYKNYQESKIPGIPLIFPRLYERANVEFSNQASRFKGNGWFIIRVDLVSADVALLFLSRAKNTPASECLEISRWHPDWSGLVTNPTDSAVWFEALDANSAEVRCAVFNQNGKQIGRTRLYRISDFLAVGSAPGTATADRAVNFQLDLQPAPVPEE